MSQSLLYHAFGVREGYEYRRTDYVEGRVEFHLDVREDALRCPRCASTEYGRRGGRYRRVAGMPIGPKPVVLVVEVPRCECRACGDTFEVSPFAPAYAHHTAGLAQYVCRLSQMMSLTDVARITHLGWDTVKNIVKSDLLKRYSNVPLNGVTRIAIDENYLGKKAKFVTLVIDLDSGHVLWIGEGRGKAALEGFWPKLQGSKAQISAVACDMSAAYWAAVMAAPTRSRHRVRSL